MAKYRVMKSRDSELYCAEIKTFWFGWRSIWSVKEGWSGGKVTCWWPDVETAEIVIAEHKRGERTRLPTDTAVKEID